MAPSGDGEEESCAAGIIGSLFLCAPGVSFQLNSSFYFLQEVGGPPGKT